MGRIEEGKVSLLHSPHPAPLISLYCSRPTRAERLATQAINHVINMFASTRIFREKRRILSFLITGWRIQVLATYVDICRSLVMVGFVLVRWSVTVWSHMVQHSSWMSVCLKCLIPTAVTCVTCVALSLSPIYGITRLNAGAARTRLRYKKKLLQSVFTWRHCGHIGVPNQSTGSCPIFLCKRFLLYQ